MFLKKLKITFEKISEPIRKHILKKTFVPKKKVQNQVNTTTFEKDLCT